MLTLWTRLPRRIDQDWFAREQVDLVAFANDPWARRYLTIDQDAPEFAHLPVVGLWGNAVHYQVNQQQRIAVFYTGDHFARRLDAFGQMARRGGEFAARVQLATPSMEAMAWAVAVTGTFNPDAHPEVTSVDGYTQRDSESIGAEAWSTIRAGAGTQAFDSDSTMLIQNEDDNRGSGLWRVLARMFLLTYTASLGAAATILSATASGYVTFKIDSTGSSVAIDLVTATPASNTALVTADHATLSTTLQAASKTISSGVTASAYNDFDLNPTGLGNINKTGVTKFAWRTDKDRTNTSPTWVGGGGAQVVMNTADNGTNKPKLIVTYIANAPVLLGEF